MKYGKNQLALLKFLEKYPNRWHYIKGRKAVESAGRLAKRYEISFCNSVLKGHNASIFYKMPQMLIEQN